jgi:hypothetical protein
MKYKIINIYAGFHNCYGDLPWRVMKGNDFIKAFKTRANARQFIKDIRI